MNTTPLVSVLMLTYNHEQYISQAIESVLAQKTSFSFQLVIGEDCSSDDTLEICIKYQKQFPDKIIILSGEKNMGLGRNFMRSFNACEGKYIAICEGDDFWTNPHKLQIQVDLLEGNPVYSICFHRIMNYYPEDGSKSLSNPSQKRVSDIIDLSRKNFIVNVSCVFRNKLFVPPQWFENISTYDYAVHMINAQFGKIYYFPKVMAVYRQHKNAIWSTRSIEKKYDIAINVRKNLIDYFQDKPDVIKGLTEMYAANAVNKIRVCRQNNNNEEALQTQNELLQVIPDFDIERSLNEPARGTTIYHRVFKLLSFFRIHLSKLYPLPQLRLK